MKEVEEILISSLKHQGADIQTTRAIMLVLKDDEESMTNLILWIADNNPTPEQIMNPWIATYLLKYQEQEKTKK